MPIFYVYLHNKTDCRDDEVRKVKAATPKEAKEIASSRDSWRWNVGRAYRAKDFRKAHPDWYSLLSSVKAESA